VRRRQSLGLLLIFLLLLGGRAVRHTLLVGSDGHWRDPLWLDNLLPPVPEAKAEAPPPPTGPFAVNVVGVDTLVHLPGIGPKLAARIVAERIEGGPFLDLDDLQRVRGIGPKLASKLGPHLEFGAQLTPAAADTSADHAGSESPASGTQDRDAPP